MENKELQFLDWLCGKKIKFPFFRIEDKPEIPDVIMPKVFKRIEKLEKYEHTPIESDIYNQEEDE